MPNAALWHALYRCGLIDAKSAATARQEAALKLLGFVPLSLDDAAYTLDRTRDEVVNERHDTLRRPMFHVSPTQDSPFRLLLEQFPRVVPTCFFAKTGCTRR